MPTATSDLMTREQAAAYLGIKPQTLACWFSVGRYDLPTIKIGRNVRYSKDSVSARDPHRRVDRH
jgi:predicted site-specific integrase-resolvase